MNKMKSYEVKINTNFFENGISKEDSCCIFLSVMLIDSIIEIGNMY